MKKIAVNVKHGLEEKKNVLECLSADTLKSKDSAFQDPTVDMLTKPSFITDSQPCEHSNGRILIGRLAHNKPKSQNFTTNLYSFSSADLHPALQAPKSSMTLDYILPFSKGEESLFLLWNLNPTVTSMSHMMWQQRQ